MSAVWEGE